MVHLVLLLQLATARAEPSADDGPPEPIPAEAPAPRDFGEMLEAAKQVYFDGDDEDAYELFLSLQIRLLQNEDPGKDLACEALIYVGEIQHRRGNFDEARDAFKKLLELDPKYQISPYNHPIEVVAAFSTVKDQVDRGAGEQTNETPKLDPMPGWGYLPLGIPQFKSKRPGLGVLFGGLQAGLGGASLGVYFNIRYLSVTFPEESNHHWLAVDHPRGWAEKETTANINRMRYTVQWPLVLAAYGVYIGSVVEARGHWRNNFVPEAQVSVLPMPDGGSQVVFSGRF